MDLTPSSNIVTFPPGQTQANITVSVLDDTIPEEQELLMLILVSVIAGDAVLVSPVQATLVIELNDDPNGVFGFFDESLLAEAEEGDVLQLMYVHNHINAAFFMCYMLTSHIVGLSEVVAYLVPSLFAG